ncbi:MAG: hypothetical protein FJ288_10780 [Planctomycetes bacterium]|nr:hypothetical protein [Planctomycetota bacterium]
MSITQRDIGAMATRLRGHVLTCVAACLAAAAVAAGGCENRPAAQQPRATENRPAAESPAVPEKPAAPAPDGSAAGNRAAAAPAAGAAGQDDAPPTAATTAASPGASSSAAPPRRVADNDRCHVCHVNFGEEVLSVSHAANNIGCERCHGPSDEHCSDEGNITAPDIMFAREKIGAACKECHPDPMERMVLDARYCLFVPLTAEEKAKVCTDCHGSHRANVRTVRWDKATGKLIEEPDADK